MTDFSDFLEEELLDHVLNGLTWASPASVWIGLYTAVPSDAGGGTEVSGTGYARIQMTGGWTVTVNVADNTAIIDFGTAGAGGWGTIGWVGIFDAVTGGNLLFWGALSATKTVNDGDSFQFAASALTVTLD